uniref:DUF4794 domain-containing protein n=1 Tax=Glossina austeni TaxID=7395 RepID=A0A1A9V499_GLOAU
MKQFLIALVIIAVASADVSHLPTKGYLPPPTLSVATSPEENVEHIPASPLSQTIDSHPANVYPPVLSEAAIKEPVPAHVLTDNGYHYKNPHRVQRDVSLPPSNEYLSPLVENSVASTEEYSAPIAGAETTNDGYRYKTQKRFVYRRQRRDVNHFSNPEYLPPSQEEVNTQSINHENQTGEQSSIAEPAHELTPDGYHYKTQKRLVYRRLRRDISRVPANNYLPPGEEHRIGQDSVDTETAQNALVSQDHASATFTQTVKPAEENPLVAEPKPAHHLTADGYSYKTQKRLVYRRQRRDVDQSSGDQYLLLDEQLPLDQGIANAEVVHNTEDEEQASDALVDNSDSVKENPVINEPKSVHHPTNDGHNYKMPKSLAYHRHRRDVSHVPTKEYLPPGNELSPAVPPKEYLPPVENANEEPQPAHQLTDDGYHYKTQRRVVYRRL